MIKAQFLHDMFYHGKWRKYLWIGLFGTKSNVELVELVQDILKFCSNIEIYVILELLVYIILIFWVLILVLSLDCA